MAKLKTKSDRSEIPLNADETESSTADYQAWKERKIRRALEQADDPSLMIPADQVWKDLGLEH